MKHFCIKKYADYFVHLQTREHAGSGQDSYSGYGSGFGGQSAKVGGGDDEEDWDWMQYKNVYPTQNCPVSRHTKCAKIAPRLQAAYQCCVLVLCTWRLVMVQRENFAPTLGDHETIVHVLWHSPGRKESPALYLSQLVALLKSFSNVYNW